MTFFEQSVFFGVSVSLAAYGIGVLLQKKFKFALFNPLLISVVLTIAVLLTAHISYDTFYEGAKYLSYLLTPATVCLAVPLYEKLSLLKSNWKAIFAGILSGVITTLCSVFVMSKLFHLTHEETVVLLSHKKPDGHINVKVEFGEGEGKVPLDNIAKRAETYKPKERVTYKMIKEYIEAKYGFKVHTAYIAEVKRDLGLPMYDAPNAVEELKQPRKHPTAEKVEAIKDALKHFEVI